MATPMVRKLTAFLLTASVLLLASCTGGGESKAPTAMKESPEAAAIVWPGDEWEVSTPEGEGMDASRLEDVATYCQAHGCRAVVVVRHGHIV